MNIIVLVFDGNIYNNSIHVVMYQCSQYKHPLILHFQSLRSEQSQVMGCGWAVGTHQ